MRGLRDVDEPVIAGLQVALCPRPSSCTLIYCSLDFSWPNYNQIASMCSDENGQSKCCCSCGLICHVCQHITSGTLGVPTQYFDACISNFADTLVAKGIVPTAASFCTLGIKIQVSYQCVGMTTIVEMLQSPNFSDVTRSCATTLSDDITCKRCLNSGLSFLRHLVGEEDNITLNACCDVAFVAFMSQGNISTVDTTSCFFTAQELSAIQVNISGLSPAELPSPISCHITRISVQHTIPHVVSEDFISPAAKV
ncbi:hypothetical protein EJB05_05739 [Eragrostis curvula]|uniref:SPARK domain-containing protein n=1 Tax=Eragrostis curvula TaxID=38414 RepID=A0A5J9WDF9_9POAL|nr:hypothetical protein EJB05_05739 [Eragrostis curvula]